MTKELTITVSDQEYEQLHAAALAAGKSISELVRHRGLGHGNQQIRRPQPPTPPPDSDEPREPREPRPRLKASELPPGLVQGRSHKPE